MQDRLVQHIRDYTADKEKYYWTTAVAFIGRDLTKAHIRYLEDRLVQITRSCKRYKVLTKNTYSKTVMKESQTAAMEEFIDNVRILINTLGYKVMEPTAIKPVVVDTEEHSGETLYLNLGGCNASGMVTSEGFVVFAGATLNEKTSTKSLSKGATVARQKLFDSDKVSDCKTTEDILFSSSSAAADFIVGYSVSGPANWKNKDGMTLKEIEAKEAD